MGYSPDRWGRTLMDCREAIILRTENRKPGALFEKDYLLVVYDAYWVLRGSLEEDWNMRVCNLE
ncbi:hypothetical protein GCM10022209_46970 [Chitinophaga oryziterrae]